MTSYSPMPLAIVVDASVAVLAVLPVTDKPLLRELFEGWHKARSKIYAPEILLPEAVSAIRRGVYERWISEAEAQTAVDDIYRLGLEFVPSDNLLCQAALAWAGRLGQSKAYDGFYLALADRLKAEFWTADRRLCNRADQVGVSWARWIGGRYEEGRL